MAKEKKDNLKSQIESILLVAEKPVSIKEISNITETFIPDVQKKVIELIDEYKNKGIRIMRKGDYVHLTSAPENAKQIAKFLNEELRHDLSHPALETLSIVTYKQPITRIEIEEIRGVNSDALLRNLMIRGLITEVGRKESLGRPILYGTTMEFLQYFGLENEEQLPKLDDTVTSEENTQRKNKLI